MLAKSTRHRRRRGWTSNGSQSSNIRHRVPWRQYQFPDFPWPRELQPKDEYPSGKEVQAYARAYAKRFGLLKLIRFNCKLLRLRWQPGSREWEVLYCDSAHEKFFKTRADYTVVCSGLYSQPYVPAYKGVEVFAGSQMHAQEFTNLSLAKGRRVVIVGAGKTALDCVCSLVASRTAASVTMLYRQAHWPMPRSILGIGIRSLLFNRATPAMLPPYYTEGVRARAADSLMRPLKRLFWRSLEAAASRKFALPGQCKPRVGLPCDLFYGGQFVDDSTAEVMRCETLTTIKGEITRFVRNGVILQDGGFLPADVVLYCTGYAKTYEYFDGETRSRLGLQKDGLYLYRNCIPPGVPHLAFVGSEVSTYSNILTHGLQALWLSHVLSGRVTLPCPAEMAADVRAQQHWRRQVMPAQRNRGSVLMLYGMQYHDQLLRDMGIRPRRKGLNLFAECFGAYSADDYAELFEGGAEAPATADAIHTAHGPFAAASSEQVSPPESA
ncbi:hypothetical protein GPECTOR_14g48 [Gonium pectorale]|uniref:Flavin-containing monooxygenase n=1 Tax=Gonium pectorale TaxID=33097 RepID=A0A150GMV8_GONPE|nr:hypothetical protein GPECTOR_14g48 [Gonium pectorale]|eukprot:KXZ51062.1 hypothetical protein GPECTOR_14g48 [Gonium pectorale]